MGMRGPKGKEGPAGPQGQCIVDPLTKVPVSRANMYRGCKTSDCMHYPFTQHKRMLATEHTQRVTLLLPCPHVPL